MKLKQLIQLSALVCLCNISFAQQVPVANFSISPVPVCSGQVIQITDLSTGSPTAWSYTISALGPGGPTVLSSQSPTHTFNFQGTYTITLIASNASGSSTAVSQTVQVLTGPNAAVNPANANTCLGGNPITINITTGGAGAANTFSWSTGATSSSISVSPTVTTVYTCVVTSTNGCSVTRTSTVNIATPTINIGSVPVSLCPGSSSTLTASGSGQAPFTYSWSTGSNVSTITASVSGVYNVTVTNNGGCSGTQSYTLGTSNTLSLTVTSTPSVLCSGNTATLHVTGASSYLWDFNQANANPTVNPSNTSTYSVVGSLGTCTGSTIYTLQVNQLPTVTVVSSTNTICAGTSVTLTANGASSYTWLPGNATTNVITVTPSVTTTYTARGLNTGCPARTGTISVVVAPSPAITITSSSTLACAGDVIALVAGGASTYNWNTGGTSAIIIVTPSVTTTYTVVGTNASNCSSTKTITQNVTDCTGLTELANASASVVVFPNPTHGTFRLISAQAMQFTLMNLNGEALAHLNLEANTPFLFESTYLAEGIYILYGSGNGQVIKQKIIISK